MFRSFRLDWGFRHSLNSQISGEESDDDQRCCCTMGNVSTVSIIIWSPCQTGIVWRNRSTKTEPGIGAKVMRSLSKIVLPESV